MRVGAFAVSTALLVSCASAPTATQVIAEAKVALDTTPPCCRSLAEANLLTLPPEPASVIVDKQSQAFDFGGNKAFFVLYELPAFKQPYSIIVTSLAAGYQQDVAIFIPRIATYDATFGVTRFFDEKTLRNRGNNLERTVFINAGNAQDRYLAIYGSDLSASIERAYSMVTVTPVVAGPVIFNMVSGVDGKSVLRSSPIGALHLEVRGLPKLAAAK